MASLPFNISVEIEASERKRLLQIDHITASRKEVHPGDNIDLTVSFSGGSSTHTHVSVHPVGGSSPNAQTNSHGLTFHEASFLSSLLDHLPGLTALTLPQPASYKRVGDGVWSGGTYVCWGTDNREAPVRLCNANSPSARNFELRFIDGLANVSLLTSYLTDLKLTDASIALSGACRHVGRRDGGHKGWKEIGGA